VTTFWSVTGAVERIRIVYNIKMTVLDRMGFFCVHDEEFHFVLVGEDSSIHIQHAVQNYDQIITINRIIRIASMICIIW